MSRSTEDDLIARHFAPLAGAGGLGLRDDAALATPPLGHDLVVSKDMLVAGMHFFPDDPPEAIARKALRVNLSDLAAKGAAPSGFLLGLGLPDDWRGDWLAAFATGLGDDAAAFGCPLLGGDTVAMPGEDRAGPLTLSITAFGTVPVGQMVPRAGAREHDRIYVTGTIGDAVLGLRIRWKRAEDLGWIAALTQADRDALLARHLEPEPRLGLNEALRRHARCAMDVSDGFWGDLAKMLRLERLGAAIDARNVPRSPAARAAVALEPALLPALLTGGDDYEILACVHPDACDAFEAAAALAGLPVASVGTVSAAPGVTIRDDAGSAIETKRASFSHF